MGDRTYASFHLGGHVETVEEVEMLIEAIDDEGVRVMTTGQNLESAGPVRTALRTAVENKASPAFDAEEVNYGMFQELETACANIPGLGMHVQWENGGTYPAGQKTIMPDGDEFESIGKDGATVPLYELVKARDSDDILAAVDALIADAKRAEGEELPDFTVSPPVAAYLKMFGDRAA